MNATVVLTPPRIAPDHALSTPQDLLDGVRRGAFDGRILVFTPAGDVVDLPAGSTPVDFAYAVHTDLGHRCIAARLNNRAVPLETRLRNGDMVEIIATDAPAGPSSSWLAVVRTPHARAEIRRWFTQHRPRGATDRRQA